MYQNLARAADATAPASVHLADYPVADVSRIDRELERRTDLVIKAVSLGRAARSNAKIRVRQPLQRFYVVTRVLPERQAIEAQQDQIRQELNVKEVLVLPDESQIIKYSVRANPKAIRLKFGPATGNVLNAIATIANDRDAIAKQVRAGMPVEIGGYKLEPNDLEVVTEDRPNHASAGDAGLVVAVTTNITPELALEGLAGPQASRSRTAS
jgi:isoleucyl-tRNA synthetase